jgi:hypothetical protein
MKFFSQVDRDTYRVIKTFQSEDTDKLREIYGDHLYIETYVGLSTHNFAGREDSFWHPEHENFYYAAKPFPSWKLNSDCNWEAPISLPEGIRRQDYHWIEESYQSDNTTGWERLKILPVL